jgi:primosomal protein N' (replication factor Y)
MLQSEAHSHPQMKIVGPAPLPVARVNEKYRFAVYVTCENTPKLRNLISNTIIACSLNKEFKGVSIHADPNPV